MDREVLVKMIDELNLEEQISFDSIPNLDLYMDQVITLFEDKLSHTKRYEEDKLLTKTMINNYIKDRLLMPAVKKKYTKEHVVLMIILYELKQVLTISDIKELFSTMIKEEKVDAQVLREVYQMYLDFKGIGTSKFTEEVMDINAYIEEKMKTLESLDSEIETDKVAKMIKVILLTQKANYYKRLAEKIIDTELKDSNK